MAVDVVFKYAELIDTSTMVGIEIGALHSPRLPRDDPNVRYLDHASKEELQAKYADNPQAAPRADLFVDVDYIWKPGLRLTEVLGPDGPIDFVIASHLLEHIPNPLGWLQQVEEILRDGGILALILPDRRYTFDARRQLTSMAQVMDAYLRDLQFASFEQIYDHEANFLGDVNPAELWNGLDPAPMRRQDVDDPDAFALARCQAMAETGEYQDVHCSTFTPESFGAILTTAMRLGLVNFELVRLYPTEPGDLEFFATLRKRDLTDPTARAQALAEAACLVEGSDGAPAHGDAELLTVSPAEARLIEGKRQAMAAVRSARAKVRQAVDQARHRGSPQP